MYNTIDSLTIIVEFNQVIVTNFGALVLKLPVVDPAPSFTGGTQTLSTRGGGYCLNPHDPTIIGSERKLLNQ